MPYNCRGVAVSSSRLLTRGNKGVPGHAIKIKSEDITKMQSTTTALQKEEIKVLIFVQNKNLTISAELYLGKHI